MCYIFHFPIDKNEPGHFQTVQCMGQYSICATNPLINSGKTLAATKRTIQLLFRKEMTAELRRFKIGEYWMLSLHTFSCEISSY